MRSLFDGGSWTFVLMISVLTPVATTIVSHAGVTDTQWFQNTARGTAELTNAVKALDEKDEVAYDTDRQIRLLNKALDASRHQLSEDTQKDVPKALIPSDRWAEDLVREAIDGVDLIEVYGNLGKIG